MWRMFTMQNHPHEQQHRISCAHTLVRTTVYTCIHTLPLCEDQPDVISVMSHLQKPLHIDLKFGLFSAGRHPTGQVQFLSDDDLHCRYLKLEDYAMNVCSMRVLKHRIFGCNHSLCLLCPVNVCVDVYVPREHRSCCRRCRESESMIEPLA
jgi:hypothetical protein